MGSNFCSCFSEASFAKGSTQAVMNELVHSSDLENKNRYVVFYKNFICFYQK